MWGPILRYKFSDNGYWLISETSRVSYDEMYNDNESPYTYNVIKQRLDYNKLK